MQSATLGNWSSGINLANVTDGTLDITLPTFVNTSLIDNTTTFGDNRAIVGLANNVVGHSREEITFHYINNFYIT